MPPSALRRGDIVRIRDERWIVHRFVSHAATAVVEVRGCDRANRGAHAQFLLPCEPVDRLPSNNRIEIVSRRRWRQLARQALGEAVPTCHALRTLAGARIDLLPFQLEPAMAIVRGLAVRLLIADEVGLGKTVQAGLVAAETLERTPGARVLVVTPASLRDQWLQELSARFDLSPHVVDSSTVTCSGLPAPGSNPWALHPLVITSIDYVKRPEVLRALEGTIWDLVIADEAHRLSGRSDRHAAAALVGERARLLVMLTATPHAGDEGTFARLCRIGDLGGQFPVLVFRRTRRDAGLPSARRTAWLRIGVTAAEQAMHRTLLRYARRVWTEEGVSAAGARLAMTVLVRRACSSASSLERSVERRLSLLAEPASPAALQLALPLGGGGSADEEPAGELGAPGLADAEDERRTLGRILTLAQQAQECESKLDALRRLLRRTREPAIVFTEYRDTLEAIASALPSHGTGQLHGGLTASEREAVLRQFADGGIDILLATDAAGEGLNLQQRCRLVINLELPWSPARLEQRIGRVDRIGQARRVHEVHLVSAGTSEETRVAPLLRKRGARARTMLARLRCSDLQERDVAAHVLSDAMPLDRDDPVPGGLPQGVVVADLREPACLEAQRAATARALNLPAVHGINGRRPFVTARHRVIRHGWWVFRLALTDASGELVFETLLGTTFEGRASLESASDVRHYASLAAAASASLVGSRQDVLRQRVISELAAATDLAAARERALAAALRARHGRMAAAILQGALFSRRADRDAAAQRDALLETLARCDAHLARLPSRLTLHVAAAPAFGLFTR